MSAWERALDQMRLRPSGNLGTVGRATRERLPVAGGRSVSDAFQSIIDQATATQQNAAQGAERAKAAASLPPTPFRIESQASQGTGPVSRRTTNPGDPGQFEPDPYPTVLPSLSAEQLGQLAERRRLADERLKQAEAEKERRKGLLEASSIRAREEADRVSKRSLQDFMREAGGKGLARSPMVAGRQVRREGEDLRLKYGEIDTRLSTEVAALQDMVSRAALERDTTIALIEQERVNMQADLDRLFPAAGMFR